MRAGGRASRVTRLAVSAVAAGALVGVSLVTVAAGAASAAPVSPLRVTATVSVGKLPSGVVASATRAYVANSQSNTVSVIDTTQSPPAVIATIPVGAYPNGMALSADGSQLYVANYLAATMTIIQTSTNTVQFVVPVGNRPDGVVFFNNFVYVANLASGTVSQVDPNLGTVVGSIALPSGGVGAAAPSGLVATPASAGAPNATLYVNDVRNGVALQVTLPTTVAGSVAAGVHPAYLSALGSTGYVASPGDNSIKVLNLATTPPTAVTSVSVGAAPYGVVADPAAKMVLATSSGANTVTAVDPATNTVIGSPVAVGRTPDTVAISPDGATVFVTNETDGTLSVLHVAVTMTGRAYGLSSSGLVTISPTPDTGSVSTRSSSTNAPACVAAIAGLISGHNLCAQVTTSTPPATSTATASVGDVDISVLGIPHIVVGPTSSASTSTCGSVATGSTTLSTISVGGIPLAVATHPTPNSTTSELGVTFTFNEQLAEPGASEGVQVNAVHITALGLLDVVIASSTSDVENC